MGFLGSMHIILYLTDTGKLQVAKHVQMDELQTDVPFAERSPYAQFLVSNEMEGGDKERLKTAILELEPDPSPWLDNKCIKIEIPSILPATELILEYDYDFESGRCKVSNLVATSPAARHVRRSNAVGNYFLLVNGQSVRTPDEVDVVICSYITLSQQYEDRLVEGLRPRSVDGYAAALNSMTLLLCKPDKRVTSMIDDLDLTKEDLGMTRMI